MSAGMKPDKAIELKNIRRIAVLRLSALGDICMVVPVIRTLQQALPQAQITWIISRPAYNLVEGLDGVEFIVIDKPRGPGDYLALRKRLQHERFDVLLAMQAALRANLIYPLIQAPLKIGFDARRARDRQDWFTNAAIPFANEHLLDSFLAFAKTLGIENTVIDWRLPIGDAERDWARQQLAGGTGRVVIVNPAASKAERNWPAERYAEVITQLQARGAQIILTGGANPEEAALIQAIERQLVIPIKNLAGQTHPKQLAALLEAADCLLAPDTGPVHMAVAVGTPVVGLYAVAPSWLSGPYRQREYVIDHYDQAVREILGKDPQTVKWGTRVHDARAMQLITVDEVLERLSAVLEGPAL
ncbi:glycosyltransferase family 9 protein [Sulfuriflexus mobilis]|uniref:glycosyltransferase family 9 protein n=1 Tax=Sulfuriflexus mobilis TaxID=1811807 RepID=UPI0018D559B2|nr:glycosyltransferase family 9 protein [Sulfuriflexus mobilis]